MPEPVVSDKLLFCVNAALTVMNPLDESPIRTVSAVMRSNSASVRLN